MKEYRNIIEIDRERCNGCGQCVLDCAEGAIAIIDGKATVVSDSYCDGLGACLSGCPQSALAIVRGKPCRSTKRQPCATSPGRRKSAGNSFFSRSASTSRTERSVADAPGPPCRNSLHGSGRKARAAGPVGERRQTWPVKLRLVPPSAPFLKGADILLAADCSAPASARFCEIASGKVVLIACPKFEDNQEMRARLVALFTEARPASVTVLRMEVPCCRGIAAVCHEAAEECGISVRELVMGRNGELCQMKD